MKTPNTTAATTFPPDRLRRLLGFMQMRQRVYLARQDGKPWPWTKDTVLRDYRLENVYREQDLQTTWLREHWLQPYARHPNLWFAACLFRQVNWSPTLAEIGFPEVWEPERVLKIMEARKARGEKVYTSAYMIPEHGEKSKPRYTVNRVLDPLWQAVATGNCPIWETAPSVSLESAHRWLHQFYGWGGESGFLTYEAITDLRHTRYLCNAPDVYTWANPGPGAKRGICWLLGVAVKTRIPRFEQIRYMREAFDYLNQNRDPRILPTLEMRDVEHSLCAYDKWCRAHDCLKAGKRVSLELFRPPCRNLFGDYVPGPPGAGKAGELNRSAVTKLAATSPHRDP
jgi:hypothetical protein